MNMVPRIKRIPRAFNLTRGREMAALFGEMDPAFRELIDGAAGSSPYLAGLISREVEWLRGAIHQPEAALDAEIARASGGAPGELADGLRQAKRRVALLTALADLGGVWTLEEVTSSLTRFADAACQAALRDAVFQQIQRGKIPGLTEDDLADAGGMCVLAMGKMGAHELNYSSDIDLICLFDESRFDPADFHEARAGFVRATRAMAALLNDKTSEGYVFRTDLRLRPDPAVTPVCMAMEAAERYYESVGRTWERAAYIKARVAAGDQTAGNRFLKTLMPFVWRRHLDFTAIQDAHDMRLAIRDHKGFHGPLELFGHNMKLGRGGIREIEFFTQTRQLIAGGRDPDLRKRGTVENLERLSQKGWIPEGWADQLSDHYRFHRTVEHRLQMVHDAQTHSLPGNDEGFERLACMMDRDAEDLRHELKERLEHVHEMTEGFFAPSDRQPAAPQSIKDEVATRWLSYPALRSDRSRTLFERLKPDLFSKLSAATKPEEAISAFDGFLKGLPAGVQLFSLLEANPQLGDLLVDIVSTSPELAAYLSRNAGVLDAVIGGDFFRDWPGQSKLELLLKAHLALENDYEARLDATRRWTKEWHFRIGVHHLRELVSAEEAARQYADLARAVVAVLWPVVIDQFALRHGPPPGRGAVVLGMGSLGAGRLNAGSDLDLIVIYDAQGVEQSEGGKPLATRRFYARLTQALITALSAPMAQGKLYEVDMRLRPSGNQGPVATSWASYQAYQCDEAWMWEHLALTRAQVVAGPEDLAHDVMKLRAMLLTRKRDEHEVLHELSQMRDRIRAAKTPDNLWEPKIGAGRLQEIELLAQAGALLAGDTGHDVSTGLDAIARLGWLAEDQVRMLQDTVAVLSKLYLIGRLLTTGSFDPAMAGQRAQAFVLRSFEASTLERLERSLETRYEECNRLIETVLRRNMEGGPNDERGSS